MDETRAARNQRMYRERERDRRKMYHDMKEFLQAHPRLWKRFLSEYEYDHKPMKVLHPANKSNEDGFCLWIRHDVAEMLEEVSKCRDSSSIETYIKRLIVEDVNRRSDEASSAVEVEEAATTSRGRDC